MSDIPTTIRATRFLKRAGVIALAGLATVGVGLRLASEPDPASPAQREAARLLIRCDGDMCFALQRFASSPAICAALTQTNAGNTIHAAQGECPGDPGFSTPVAAQRNLRFLACAARDGAIDAWYAFNSPRNIAGVCGVEILMRRAQARAWVNRLDASTTTTLVNVRRSLRHPDLLTDGGAPASVWAGIDPNDETDDSASIDFSDPLDGGAP